MGMEKGYFREEGLEDVELIAFPDDESAQIEALASGLVDVALDPQTRRVLAKRDQRVQIYIVAARRGRHSFVIFGQKWMRSIEDLRGQTLYLDEEGAPSLQLRQVLKMAGMQWGKEVKIVNRTSEIVHNPMGSERKFLEGESLIHNVQPWEVEKWSRMGYPVLADTTKLLPPRQDRIVAAGELADKHPETLKAFLKGYLKSGQFLLSCENSELKAIVERAGFLDNDIDRENFPITLERVRNRIAPDGRLPLDGVEQAIQEQREEGAVSEKFAMADVLRLEPLRQAQRELGIELGD